MGRGAAAALLIARALAKALVVVVAVAGLLLTIAYTLVGTRPGSALLVPRVLALVNGAIQGHVEVEAFRLLPRGAVEIQGARVRDPDGEVVIEAGRVVAGLDLMLLRLRTIAADVEIDDPSVVLERSEDGELTIAQAFRLRHPSPKKEEGGESTWTVRVDRLAVHGGEVQLVDADGERKLAARGIEIGGRASTSRGASDAEVRLDAHLHAPVQDRVTLDAAASLRGGVVRVSRLRAAVGETALDALAEWDLAARSGRALVRSLAVSAAEVDKVLPKARLSGDLQGTLYAEAADGIATLAFDLAQRPAPGRATGAAALRMSAPLVVAFDAELTHVDPARAVALAPPGDLTLTTRGWLRGTDPRKLVAEVDLDARPSVLRGARFGPARVHARAAAGAYRVDSLDVTVPGARVRGSGSYASGGVVVGSVHLAGADLATAVRTVERVTGRRLPAISGTAAVDADVSGTARAPRARFDLRAARLRVDGVEARDLKLSGVLGGTAARPQATVSGAAGELLAGREVLRRIAVAASIDDRATQARVTATSLRVGPDPLTVSAQGALARDWRTLDLSALAIEWPHTRYALTAPARVEFAGPRVDRLELASGPTRIALEGGLSRAPGPRRRSPPRTLVDAHVTIEAFDLSTLPRDLLPRSLGLAGVVALDARASGPLAAPDVTAHVEAADGQVDELAGLSLVADAAWDGAARRARISATGRRTSGGELVLRADVPAALGRARPGEPLSLTAAIQGFPLEDLAHALRRPEPITGLGNVDVALGGTVGAPKLDARVLLAEVRYGAYGPYELETTLTAPGEQARLEAVFASASERFAEVTASVPLDLAAALREPARTARAVLDAPLQAQVNLPEFDLARFAGEFGLPSDLAGRMRGGADLSGKLRAPRGSLGLEASGVTAYGYTEAGMQFAVLLSPDSTGVAGSIDVGREELVQVSGYMAAPAERLGDLTRVAQMPLDLDVVFPGADLARTGGPVPLTGRLDGRVHATGTLSKLVVEAAVDGRAVTVAGKPLGDPHLRAHGAGMSIAADLKLDVAAGGVLTAKLTSTAEMSLDAFRRGDLRSAPSELHIVADRVSLGVLPALLPGRVRTASGELGADLAARGPLSSLRPVGTLRITNGRAAIAEMGDWTGIEVDATLTADAFKVDRLQAMRGHGTLDATAEAHGLAGIAGPEGKPAPFTAQLRTRDLTIPRAGQDLATLDLEATAKGTIGADELKAEVTVPRGTVTLPERSPKRVQTLEKRDDIVIVSSFADQRAKEAAAAAAAAVQPKANPYRLSVRVLLPNRFFIVSSNPRMNIELQADTTFDVAGGGTSAEGHVTVLRGYVEPIGGRNFTIERGRVTFTGAAPTDAVVDVVARYENPAANVTVTVSGSTSQPVIKMTSEPPMDEAQIAMLIATGRTELKAGSGAVGTLTGEEAGRAALGAVATQLFKNVIANKLPVDSVALSSSEIRAGKYLTDKIYVGYTRNFDARPELNENTNEVRVEYQISPRWTFESRYGDARTGGASIIWSKDY